jgi:altronate dehydratase
MLREVAAAGHRVDLIMQVFGNMPPGNPLPHLKRNMDAMVNTPNFGAVLFVGRERVSAFGQHLVSLLLRLYGRDTPSKSVFCASLEEAYAALARLREGENG